MRTLPGWLGGAVEIACGFSLQSPRLDCDSMIRRDKQRLMRACLSVEDGERHSSRSRRESLELTLRDRGFKLEEPEEMGVRVLSAGILQERKETREHRRSLRGLSKLTGTASHFIVEQEGSASDSQSVTFLPVVTDSAKSEDPSQSNLNMTAQVVYDQRECKGPRVWRNKCRPMH